MYYVYGLIFSLVTAAALFATIRIQQKMASGGGGAIIKQKNDAIEEVTVKLRIMTRYEEAYASPLQLSQIQNQLTTLRDTFSKQSAQLKEIEDALDKSQKGVEEKETRQQEYKSLKEEDENKLTELLTNYEALSQESITLEQQLADSIKNVEEMLAGTTLSVQEREILGEFNEALISAGGRLRDLVTEYQVVKERLDGLQVQFKDLEDEYTRLVEQQLGIG